VFLTGKVPSEQPVDGNISLGCQALLELRSFLRGQEESKGIAWAIGSTAPGVGAARQGRGAACVRVDPRRPPCRSSSGAPRVHAHRCHHDAVPWLLHRPLPPGLHGAVLLPHGLRGADLSGGDREVVCTGAVHGSLHLLTSWWAVSPQGSSSICGAKHWSCPPAVRKVASRDGSGGRG
jgi:hypothetical protein